MSCIKGSDVVNMGQQQSKKDLKDKSEVSANKGAQKSKTVCNKTYCTADDEQLSTLKASVRSQGHDSIEETQTTDFNHKEEKAKKETNEKIHESESSFVVLNKKRADTSRCQDVEYKSTKNGIEACDFSKEVVEQTFQDVHDTKPKKDLNRKDAERTLQNGQDIEPKKDLIRKDAEETYQDVQNTKPKKDLNRDDVEKTFQDVQDTKPKKDLNSKDVENTFQDVHDTKPKKDLNREDVEENVHDIQDAKPKKDLNREDFEQNIYDLKAKKKSESFFRQYCNEDASNQRNLPWEEFYALIQKQINHKLLEKVKLVVVKVGKVMPYSVVSCTKEILKWLFLMQMLLSKEPTSHVMIQPSEHKTFYYMERKCEMSLSYQNIIMTNLHPYRRVWSVFAVGDDSGYDPEVWLFTSSAVITAILLGQERDRHLRLGAFRLATFGFYIHAYMPENTLKLAREGYFCDVDGQVRCYQCSSMREEGEGSSQTAHCPIPPEHQVNSIDDYGIDALLPREPLTDLHTSRQGTRLAYALTRRGVVPHEEGETKQVESEAGRGSINGKENSVPRAEHGSTVESKPLARRIIPVSTSSLDDPMNQMYEELMRNNGPSINRSGQPSNLTSQNDTAILGDPHAPPQNTTRGSNIALNAPLPEDDDMYSPIHGGLNSDRSELISGRRKIYTVSPYEAAITAEHDRSRGSTSEENISETKRESMPSNNQSENTGNLQNELPEVVLFKKDETKLSMPPIESEAGRGSINRKENSIPRAEHGSTAEPKPLARRIIPVSTSSLDDPMNQMYEEWMRNNGPSINRSGQPSNLTCQNDNTVLGDPYAPPQNTIRGSNITSNAPLPHDDTYSPIHGGLYSDRSALISGRKKIGTVSSYEAAITAEHDRRSGSTSEENRSEKTSGQRESMPLNIQSENTGNLQRELPKDDEDEESESENSDKPV